MITLSFADGFRIWVLALYAVSAWVQSSRDAKPLGRGPDDHEISQAETRIRNNGFDVLPWTRNWTRGVIIITRNVQITPKSDTWCQRHHAEYPKDVNVMSHDVIVSITTSRWHRDVSVQCFTHLRGHIFWLMGSCWSQVQARWPASWHKEAMHSIA